MKHDIRFQFYLSVLLGLFFIIGCEKDKDDTIPHVALDIEGNVYHIVTIGTQTWMVENLRTTKFNDGTSITNVMDDGVWSFLATPGMCSYNNTTNTDDINAFGILYNWYAVNSLKLAPKGWHVPSDSDWTVLIDYLGGENVAAFKLREAGATHWQGPNAGATNESGFTALPGGYRFYYDGKFSSKGNFGFWWSSSEYSNDNGWYRSLGYGGGTVYKYNNSKATGCSVRCLRD